MTYAERVRELEEREGMSTSDAQAIADAEQMQGQRFTFDEHHPADSLILRHIVRGMQ